MTPADALTFAQASTPEELAQIAALNYETFVEEIPQHHPNPEHRLVDKFDAENTYFVCHCGDTVVGMVTARARRPFSLDAKVPDLDRYLPPHQSVCEVRLLAVRREYRHTRVIAGLLAMVCRWCEERGHDLAIISGTVRQQELYQHMGFVPFASLVGTADALYQPMYLTYAAYCEKTRPLLERSFPGLTKEKTMFLPGPVPIAPPVRAAWRAAPISHRSAGFRALHRQTRQKLCALTGARHVALAMGCGTVANDMIAAQLSLLSGRGLVLTNGEFGERLRDHADRLGLAYDTVEAEWGQPLSLTAVEAALAETPRAWAWTVHAETSTGVLNDAAGLAALCSRHGTRLCLDCVSTLGVVPVDLADVYLASSVSGKALGSFSGLGIVFYNQPIEQSDHLPRSLDLGLYHAQEVPFTMQSDLVNALHRALDTLDIGERVVRLAELARWLRGELRAMGLSTLAPEPCTFPGATTIPLPRERNSLELGDRLDEAGFLLSYRSRYLVERNWIQICLMWDATREALAPLLGVLKELV